MVEAREDLALVPESSQDELGVHPAVHDLEGHLPLEVALPAHGAVDAPHPALTDLLVEDVRSDAAGAGRIRLLGQERGRERRGRGRLEEVGGSLLRVEETGDLGEKVRVFRRRGRDEGTAPVVRALERFLENTPHVLPALGRHAGSLDPASSP